MRKLSLPRTLALLIAVGGVTSCRTNADPPAAPAVPAAAPGSVATAEGSQPSVAGDWTSGAALAPDLSVQILSAGRHRLTFGDLLESEAIFALLDDRPFDAAAALGALRDEDRFRSAVLRLLEQRLLRQSCEELGVAALPGDIATQMLEFPAVARLRDLTPEARAAELGSRGVRDEELLRVLGGRACLPRWINAVEALVKPEHVRFAWDELNDRITAQVGVIAIVPPADAVEAALAARGAEVEALWRETSGFYMQGERVRVRVVRDYVAADDQAERLAARARLAELRTRALTDGVAVVLPQSEDLGRLAPDGTVTAPLAQYPGLGGLAPGQVSEVIEDSLGVYFAEVLERIPEAPRPLDLVFRRELMAKILARESVTPEAMAAAQKVLTAFRDTPEELEALKEQVSFRLVTTPPFSRGAQGTVAGVGAAPRLAARMFAELDEDGEMLPEPMHEGEALYVVRLLERTRGTDAAFEAERETFTASYVAQVRQSAWGRQVARFMDSNPPLLDYGAFVEQLDRLSPPAP